MHKISRFLIGLALLAAPVGIVFLQAQGVSLDGTLDGTLDIYVLDTDGGESVLYIAPTGEAMLFDTGGGDEVIHRHHGNRLLQNLRI